MKDAERLSEKRQKAFLCETFPSLEDNISFYLDNLDRLDSKGDWIREDEKGEGSARKRETAGDWSHQRTRGGRRVSEGRSLISMGVTERMLKSCREKY